jgi:hypothetical protein
VVQDDGEEALIKAVHTHPRYKDQFEFDDEQYAVSLVETKEPMNLTTDYAEVKALASANETHGPGTICNLAGYGITTVGN